MRRSGAVRLMGDTELTAVADALTALLRCSTARFRYARETDNPFAPDQRHSSEAEGVIDFRNCRYEVREGLWAAIVDRGRKYVPRENGLWEKPIAKPDTPPIWGEPLWMLQLLRGVVKASAEPDPQRAGAGSRRLACIADLVTADEKSPNGVAVPPDCRLRDLREVPASVQIGSDKLLNEVSFRLWFAAARLELFAFNDAGGVELPPENRLVDWEPPPLMKP